MPERLDCIMIVGDFSENIILSNLLSEAIFWCAFKDEKDLEVLN